MKSTFAKLTHPIQLVVFDVDGVFTDGKIWFNTRGEECTLIHAHDGVGLQKLLSKGVLVATLSGRQSEWMTNRLKGLNIPYVFHGQNDKITFFKKLLKDLNVSHKQAAYVGDDLPDLAPIKHAALGITVPNAIPEVKEAADWITYNSGGQGAVREICDRLVDEQSS